MTDLGKRVLRLEAEGAPSVRFCWVGNEPRDLRPGEELVVVSWEGEEDR